MKMQISVTADAITKLTDLGVTGDQFLRLAVKPGGCAGMSYAAVVDDLMEPKDQVVYQQGLLRIAAHERFLPLLDGLTIDFSDDLIRPGFILKNPNAQQSCGCGSSFKAGGEAASDCGECSG